MTADGRPGPTRRGGEGARSLSAAAVAHLVGGELVGDGAVEIRGVAPLDRAESDELSFFAHAKYAQALRGSRAGALLVAPELAATADDSAAVRIVVTDPYTAMLAVLPELYAPPENDPGIDPTARIGRGARLGAKVRIGPFAVIGSGAVLGDGARVDAHCDVGDGVTIGAQSRLFPSVTLYPGTTIGARVTVHAGVRLGSDGFGYVYRDGAHQKIPHVGRCIIHDDVEIGANTTIDRGSIDDTVVGAGTKIDNLVHIAHNVRIGRLCFITAQVGIAGSTRIGDGVSLGGQAGVNGHITIGSGARIAGQAGVFGDVPDGETWSGYPARPHADALRAQAALNKLAAVAKELLRLTRGDGR